MRLGVVVSSSALVAIFAACSGEGPALLAPGDGGAPTASGPAAVTNACATPAEGCPCTVAGATAACGTVHRQVGSFVECAMGTRSCVDGAWGDCEASSLSKKSLATPRPDGLQPSSTCADAGIMNVCDPYCNVFVDTGDGTDIPTDGGLVVASEGGITIGVTAGVASTCTSLTISAAASSVQVTSWSPFTISPSVITFTPSFLPAGCAPAGLQPTWTVSRPDLATIDASGNLSVFAGVAGLGLIDVQAFFGSLSSNSAPVDVRVRVNDESGALPNVAAAPLQTAPFWTDLAHTLPATPTAATDVSWLYPYAGTYFPLALPAPVVMYAMAANPHGTAKVTLRYPSGSTATTSIFESDVIVAEQACLDPAQCASPMPALDPQIVLPVPAWNALSETAQGANADLVVQRYAGGALQAESVQTVHFAAGQLKGTVWYGSYSSALAGYEGAVLKITPGATAPVLGIQNDGQCVTCHSMNQSGTTAIANGFRASPVFGSGGDFDSQRFDTTSSANPTPVLQNYNDNGSLDNTGIQWNYGGPRTDGTVYLTHGAGTSATSDQNFRANEVPSRFFNPTTPTPTSIPVSGWAADEEAVTPKFSVDGSKIAFGFWGGTGLAQTPSGTLASGNEIAVVDFSCGSPCTAGSVSNARNVTPGMSSTQRLAWPTFTPDGNSVVFQRQIVDSNAVLYFFWSPSAINTIGGAQADLWISNVPADASTASVPTQMKAANGLTPGGATYLPQIPRLVSPPVTTTPFHVDGASYGIVESDECFNFGTVSNISDTRLNYLPAFAPVQAGGLNWVVFSSRRMYGSIATNSPFDAEPYEWCSSGTPQTKKLWVAAVDSSWTPGSDPSHPAFYLPGQELIAGNSTAYWVNQVCGPTGSSCDSDSDCCQSPAESCRINLPVVGAATRTCQLASSCAPAGSTCMTDADCCGSPIVQCLGSTTKVCAPAESFPPSATLTVDFTATCPPETGPVWQLFRWQAIASPLTPINFSAQTGASFSALGPSVGFGQAAQTIVAPVWGPALTSMPPPQTVDQALRSAVPPQASDAVLRVSMTFVSSLLLAPTLYDWQQFYDCVPSQ
jgi:hypothetical protein